LLREGGTFFISRGKNAPGGYKLEEVETYLPLSEVTAYILLSLAPGPRHGYAIMKDVQALSKERVILSTGTLYGAIKRLLEQEWIERVEDPNSNSTGRQRKFYRLTELGRNILNAEVHRINRLVAAAQLRQVGEQG
jgi:DNA-binding PadR family transcriptional regulator